jgi:hypothetical protein
MSRPFTPRSGRQYAGMLPLKPCLPTSAPSLPIGCTSSSTMGSACSRIETASASGSCSRWPRLGRPFPGYHRGRQGLRYQLLHDRSGGLVVCHRNGLRTLIWQKPRRAAPPRGRRCSPQPENRVAPKATNLSRPCVMSGSKGRPGSVAVYRRAGGSFDQHLYHHSLNVGTF